MFEVLCDISHIENRKNFAIMTRQRKLGIDSEELSPKIKGNLFIIMFRSL